MLESLQRCEEIAKTLNCAFECDCYDCDDDDDYHYC